MNPIEFAAQMRALLAEEAQQTQAWWWLSFADEDGFRGVVIVRACGLLHAVRTANKLEINPGGEVLGYPLPDNFVPAAGDHDVLLDRKRALEVENQA